MTYPTNRRVRTIHLVLLIVTVCLPFQSALAKFNTGNSLWQKAVTIAAANKHWVPELAVLRIEILDKQGKAEQAEERLLEFDDLVSLNIVGTSPFEPEFQDEISAYPTGETKDIDGKQCVKYEYVWDKQDEVLTGAAWLEQERGIPVEIEFSSSGNTQFARRQHVTIVFRDSSCDAWFPLRMTMQIGGGLLTLGRNFRIILDYQAYGKTE